jgi:hypothetical protein
VKRREVVEVMLSGPRVYAVFRIVSDQCWLVRESRARVGEEFIFTPREPYIAVGPLVPGTAGLATDSVKIEPGDLDYWEFMEYRVAYAGQDVAYLPYQGRRVKKSKRKR